MFHCLLSDVFYIKLYQIVIDKAVDTPGHGKYLVDGFNDVQKRYLTTCLMMRSKPEVENIDSKRMPVDSMTNKGEEYLCGEIGTKGDKKHVKHNYRARLNKK